MGERDTKISLLGRLLDHARATAYPSGCQRGVRQVSHPQRDIDARFDQVDIAIVEKYLDLQRRMG